MTNVRVLRYGLLVGLRELEVFWNWYTYVAGWILRILAQAAFFTLLGELLQSKERLQYLLVGNAALAGALSANLAIPISTWDRADGTYPLLVVAPSSIVPAIVGRTSVWAINGAVTSTLALVILGAIFGVGLPWPWTLLAPALLLLTSLSAYCLALFLGAVVARHPGLRSIVSGLALTVLMAFCGVSVPVDFWPESIQLVASILPLTHGLEALRLLLNGGEAGEIVVLAAIELAIAAGWLLVAMLMTDRLADAGRADGSIDLL